MVKKKKINFYQTKRMCNYFYENIELMCFILNGRIRYGIHKVTATANTI